MRYGHLPLAIGRVAEAGAHILFGKVREVGQHPLDRRARSQIREDVIDGDAHTADARFAAALPGFDRNDVPIRHNHGRLLPPRRGVAVYVRTLWPVYHAAGRPHFGPSSLGVTPAVSR